MGTREKEGAGSKRTGSGRRKGNVTVRLPVGTLLFDQCYFFKVAEKDFGKEKR